MYWELTSNVHRLRFRPSCYQCIQFCIKMYVLCMCKKSNSKMCQFLFFGVRMISLYLLCMVARDIVYPIISNLTSCTLTILLNLQSSLSNKGCNINCHVLPCNYVSVFFYRKQCKASVVLLSTDDFEMHCVCCRKD